MPVVLIYGDEDYLVKRALAELRAQVVDPAMASLSHKILETPRIHEVLESVGAVTFSFGGGTLYEIHDVPWFYKAVDGTDEKQINELRELLESLDAAKHVVFIQPKINKTIKWTKWFLKLPGVTVQEFSQLPFWEIDKAVQRLTGEAKKRKIQLQSQAALLLVEQMGTALQPLMNEVEKLAVYASGPIEVRHVQALSNHNENTFEMLADWVHGKPRAPVFQTLDELLLRQHPLQLFALIQTFINGLFQLRLWQQLGYNEAMMAERSKKHPFRIKKDLQSYARVSFDRLSMLKEKTLDMEYRSKTGELDARLALEILLGA